MNKVILFLLVLLPLISCRNVTVIENKNEAGQLVERFTIDPKTKLKEGIHETFFTENGGKCEESNYKAGVLRGEQIFYRRGTSSRAARAGAASSRWSCRG